MSLFAKFRDEVGFVRPSTTAESDSSLIVSAERGLVNEDSTRVDLRAVDVIEFKLLELKLLAPRTRLKGFTGTVVSVAQGGRVHAVARVSVLKK